MDQPNAKPVLLSRHVKITYAWIAGFSVLVNALVLVAPLYMLQIYDRVLVSTSFDTLIMISLLAVVALIAYGVLDNVRSSMAGKAAANFESDIHPRIFASLIRGRTQNGGEPLRDVTMARNLLAGRPLMGLFDLPFTPVFVALVYLIHPWLGTLTVAGLALLVAIAIANDRFMTPRQATGARKSRDVFRKTQALVRDRESITAMGMTAASIAFWRADQISFVRDLEGSTRAGAVFSAISRATRMGLQLAVLGTGAYLVLEGEMTAGMIFASSIISARAISPIEQAVGGWSAITQGFQALGRLRDVLASSPEDKQRTSLPEPKGTLSVSKLLYHPAAGQGREPIVRNVSFELDAGQALGIVGASGAGKTTLARLIVGALPPTAGLVTIDGVDLRSWPDDARFRHFGYLEQGAQLLPGTVAENISRLDPNRDDTSIVAVAKLVGIHEFVGQLPDSYETVVGQDGVRLSGGQTQRIALARAFYGTPRFVVLDEPNAFQDAKGEEDLAAAIERARSLGVTTIIVTQRQAILKAVDLVLVMKDGTAEAIGPAEAMIARMMGSRPVPASEPAPEQNNSVRSPSFRFGW